MSSCFCKDPLDEEMIESFLELFLAARTTIVYELDEERLRGVVNIVKLFFHNRHVCMTFLELFSHSFCEDCNHILLPSSPFIFFL